jgi:hypothetical protein
MEFEMKDLGKTKYCLGLQLENLSNGIFVYQSAYIDKILKKFNMDKAYPIKTPMVVRSLDIEKDPFRPQGKDEEVLGPQVPYLSAIGALMYLANNTRPNIEFAVNLLARHSAAPTKRHWVGVKSIFRYLNGTRDLGLFYGRSQNPNLIGYTDAGYLSDPHNGRSQTGFVFFAHCAPFPGSRRRRLKPPLQRRPPPARRGPQHHSDPVSTQPDLVSMVLDS